MHNDTGVKSCAWQRPAGLLLLIAAAYFRFWNLRARGFFYFDEAMYAGNGRYFGGLMRTAVRQLLRGRFNAQALWTRAQSLWLAGGSPWMHARPLHESLLIAFAFLFGDSTMVAQYISAVAGIASVALLFRIPVRGKSWSGVWAAALLGFSVWHVQYSRCALSQAVSLLTVCIVLWLLPLPNAAPRSAKQSLALCLAAGFALTSHYNLFWLPPLVWCWLAAETWRDVPSVKDRWARLSRAAAWMALPFLGFQVATWTIKGGLLWAFHHRPTEATTIRSQVQTYFEQLHNQIFLWHGGPRHALSPGFLPAFLFTQEHWIFASVLAAGLLHLIWRTARGDAVARGWLLFIATPVVIWTGFGYPAPRSFAPILPALCLGAGEGAGMLLAIVEKRWGVKAASTVALAGLMGLAALQTPRLLTLSRAVSPWKTAAARLAAYQDAHGGDIADAFLTGGYAHGILRYALGTRIDRTVPKGDLFIWDATCHFPKWSCQTKLDSLASIPTPVDSFDADLSDGMILADAFDPEFIARYRAGNLPHRFAIFDMRLLPMGSGVNPSAWVRP